MSQVRDTAVAHRESNYSEHAEKLVLYCISYLLSATRLHHMCMGLPHGPALLEVCLPIHARYIHSPTSGLLITLSDHPKL